jgi:hypothetical protein
MTRFPVSEIREAHMVSSRVVVVLLVLFLGGLQAWDSNVHGAGPFVLLLVAVGIALPAVAALSWARPGPILGAGLVSFVLLLAAKIASPIPLPALLVVPAAVTALLLLPCWTGRAAASRAG